MDAQYPAPLTAAADQMVEGSKSAVSLAAIFAGTAVAISTSLALLPLGSGLGFASLIPSARSAASPAALAATAAVWLMVVQWLSAASGGYVTGRLRTRWVGTHTHEVFFRDTAHGFVTWAVATAVVALFATSAVSSLLGGGIHAASSVAQGAASNARIGAIAPYDVDTLFRPTSGDANSSSTDARSEATRILANGLSTGGVPEADRTYLASLIAARTGISQFDAQKRVDNAVARVKEAEMKARQEAETARKTAATSSLLTTLAMMIGAFVACAAAALGGHERDRHP
jgi:hypothetical protein